MGGGEEGGKRKEKGGECEKKGWGEGEGGK